MKWHPGGVGQRKHLEAGSRVEFVHPRLETWPDLMAIDGGGPWTPDRASERATRAMAMGHRVIGGSHIGWVMLA